MVRCGQVSGKATRVQLPPGCGPAGRFTVLEKGRSASWAALGRSLARLERVLRGLEGVWARLGSKNGEKGEEKRREREEKRKVNMLRKPCVLRVGIDVGVVL